MTFFEWMKEQIKRDDIVGDLARDMVDDARFNSLDIQTVEEWKKRIWRETTWENVRKAFQLAQNEYKAQQSS